MRLIVTHPSCSIKTPPCCSTSRFIVCHPGRPGPHRDRSAATPLLLPAANPLLSHRCHQGRPGPHRGRSPGAPLLLLPAADPLLPHRCQPDCPGLSEAIHRQHCCCCLPRSHHCPTDVTQDVPTSTVVVHRQRRCWCPPRTPMSPRPPRPPPLPWSFTGSAAAYARRGHRCRPGRPDSYRGRSPAAPLLVPTADTDVAQAVPAFPRPFADSTAAAACRGPTTAPPMSHRTSRPPPWSFTGSAAAGAHRGHRCRPGRPGPSTVVVHRQRRCWCPPRTPMSPRPSRLTAPPMITDAAAAAPPMSPEKPPATCADAR